MEPNEASKKMKRKNYYNALTTKEREAYIRRMCRNKRIKRTMDSSPNAEDQSMKRSARWLERASNYQVECNRTNISRPSCSELHRLGKIASCIHCGAMKFQYESPTFYCNNGETVLVEPCIPDELYNLLTSDCNEGVEFRRNIRAYNSVFSFTSFGVALDKNLASSRDGIYTFRAQGQIYHSLPGLIPQNDRPRFFQLYFYDTDNELQNRMNVLQEGKLSENTMKTIMKILEDNPYAKILRRLKDVPTLRELQICISKNTNLDQRIYNSPTAEQVAAIWIEGYNPNEPLNREIIIQEHSGQRHQVKHYYSCYDPLQYPILFPNGESGWQQFIYRGRNERIQLNMTEESQTLDLAGQLNDEESQDIERQGGQYVSCREYYCYKLQIRNPIKSILLLAGRLFQQFAVDMYVKLETTRLDFFRKQQSNIRAELYQGIVDSVTAGETRGDQVGHRVVLPPSFIGGPRDMRRRYMDAMALVQRYGKPDLFITITCNPDWDEIRNELLNGQTAQDRPDLSARVFRGKIEDLKDQLFKEEVFGKVAARVYVIEFQKRGLPHAHILLILKHEYKLMSPDHFDKFISAELPDQSLFPMLHAKVVKHMVHGPCGSLRKTSPCMVDGKCKYHYPRSFCSKTSLGGDGYPIYMRRNDGKKIFVRNTILDNQWIVPYNPYLLSRYNCHVNVEVCSGLKAVKYLYKYIYKGHDKAAVCITSNEATHPVDEIKQYQDARWVSAQEAIWRIFEFKLNDIQPPVINHQLHLPNKQNVYYWNNEDLRNIMTWEHTAKTMLTRFFRKCASDQKARMLLYKEFPEHYVWVVGKKCPTSWDDLLTVGGLLVKTFKESAQKRGLLESDDSIVECLDEAVNFKMPYALRRLFATILVYCQPTNVRLLWERYRPAMSEDFVQRSIATDAEQTAWALEGVNYFLESMGKTIQDFDLPKFKENEIDNPSCNLRIIQDEIDVEVCQEDIDGKYKLNEDQRKAFEIIMNRVNMNKGGVFFIDGPGGTGKTFLYKTILANVRSKGMIAIATATSGVAASLLLGGRTSHSRFKIPINATETTVCNISKQEGTAHLIRKAALIIWDEAPMAKRVTIESVDRTMQDLLSTKELFGGKVVVFGGDFRQVLPVIPRGTRSQTVNASLVKSYLWEKMEKITLKINMRAKNDEEFSKFLLRVGNGTEKTTKDELIRLPESIVIEDSKNGKSEVELLNQVFP
ncbi:uncharacterized protein LOC109842248 [Asparagus officinalis]|uniref:uncharacterized protein LOC109842248 n=1 Tax=Asparagus officinalis TaxID=4686 RepID=UPI00098E08AD|nr:uncharacterized protein LOC109842248 [Asparagus officinalis]